MSAVIEQYLAIEPPRDSPRHGAWRQLHRLYLNYRIARQRYEASFHYGERSVPSGDSATATMRPGLLQLQFDDPRAIQIMEKRQQLINETHQDLTRSVTELLAADFMSYTLSNGESKDVLTPEEEMYVTFLLMNERRDDWQPPVWELCK